MREKQNRMWWLAGILEILWSTSLTLQTEKTKRGVVKDSEKVCQPFDGCQDSENTQVPIRFFSGMPELNYVLTDIASSNK